MKWHSSFFECNYSQIETQKENKNNNEKTWLPLDQIFCFQCYIWIYYIKVFFFLKKRKIIFNSSTCFRVIIFSGEAID